jgi:hypothetical protein
MNKWYRSRAEKPREEKNHPVKGVGKNMRKSALNQAPEKYDFFLDKKHCHEGRYFPRQRNSRPWHLGRQKKGNLNQNQKGDSS